MPRSRPAVHEAPGAAAPLDDSRLRRLLGYNLSRADIHLRRAFAQSMAPVNLRPAEYAALVLIAENAGVNQKQLGESLDISPPNLAVLLDRLAERGLVTRTRSDQDRRAQELQLTAAGQVLLARAEELTSTMEEGVFALLSDGERAILIEILQKLDQAAGREARTARRTR